MIHTARWMKAGVRLLSLAAGCAAWAGGIARPGPVFQIGRPDGSASEFRLGKGAGWRRYAEEVAGPVVFTAGHSDPAESWPYIHPGVEDRWAGGRRHPFTVLFRLERPPAAPLFLVIEQLNAYMSPSVRIRLNGRDAGVKGAPDGSGDCSGSADRGLRKACLLFEIPPGLFRAGENRLEITLLKGSWLIYDCVRLCAEIPEGLIPVDVRDEEKALKRGKYGAFDEIVFATRNTGPNDEHWYANFGYYCGGPRSPAPGKAGPPTGGPAYGTEGRLCAWNIHTGKLRELIADPGCSVRDPCVSYDGRRILFSMRPKGDGHYHLYEINADGTGRRQITSGGYDDIEPCYLPGGGAAFCSGRARRWVQCWLTQVATVYRCELDPSPEELRSGGKGIRMLSCNADQDNTPWPMPDGRILYTRWEYVDRSQVNYHHLWTMNPDGTVHSVFFGNLNPGGVFIDAKPIPGSTDVVLIDSPGHGDREHRGFIARISAKQGPDRLSNKTRISRQSLYRDPWAFGDGLFMAAKGRELALMNSGGDETVIYRLPGSFKNCELHEPRPLMAHPREKRVADKTDPAEKTGVFFLEDIYAGRRMRGVPRGTVRKLMVMEVLPKPLNYTGGMEPLSYAGTFILPRMLGAVPVEEDGSASFEAPAARPLFFIALDGRGRAVKRMQSFTQVMPGERLGCVGCHERRTEAPASSAPRGRLVKAMSRPPSKIDASARRFDVADFPRHVQPVLNRHCVRCHNPDGRAGGVDLSGDRGPMFSMGYYNLVVRGQVRDGRNYAKSDYPPYELGSGGSPLMKKLDGSHHGVRPPAGDVETVAQWLDASAPYPGTYAALATGMIGGYLRNRQVLNNDRNWPASKAAGPVYQKRCASCHGGPGKGFKPLPRFLSDENGLSFWDPSMQDPRILFNRHVVFDLTRPEKSLYLRAPLSREAGGLDLCRRRPEDPPVFASADDPGYRALLAMIEAGGKKLGEIKRFDMPGFRPRPEYVREMKRYGVLGDSYDPDDPDDPAQDVYAIDRLYWDSFIYRPPRAGAR